MDDDATSGIRMQPQETWRLYGVREVYDFLRKLPLLFPDDCVLYVEGKPPEDVREFLAQRMVAKPANVAPGTLGSVVTITFLPPSVRKVPVERYHIPLTRDNAEALADLAENHAEPEVCDHLHVYKHETMLMEGHDWYDGEFYVTGQMPEDTIRGFCESVGCRYERSDAYGPIQ